MKNVLTPNGDYVSLQESGLEAIGIKTDEQIEAHNRMQAVFNQEDSDNKDRCNRIEKIYKTINDIVERNNIQSEYKELKKQCLSLESEILAIGLIVSNEDREILRSLLEQVNYG